MFRHYYMFIMCKYIPKSHLSFPWISPVHYAPIIVHRGYTTLTMFVFDADGVRIDPVKLHDEPRLVTSPVLL